MMLTFICSPRLHCMYSLWGGSGKREAHINWFIMAIPENAAPLLELPWGLLATLCRRTLGSDRYRYVIIAWPDWRPVGRWRYSVNKWTMTPPRKAGGIPWVSTRFSLSVENEQADAGRNGRTCLASPSSQARAGTGKKTCFLFSWTQRGLLATSPGWSIDRYYLIIRDDNFLSFKSNEVHLTVGGIVT